MKLSDFIEQNGLTHEQMAERVGDCSVSGLRKWLRGERVPRPDQMRKIAEITDGLVSPNDFYGFTAPSPEVAE